MNSSGSSSPPGRVQQPLANHRLGSPRALLGRLEHQHDVTDELVAQFGPAVLAAPPREGFHWVAWLLPLAGLLAGAVVISILVWRWSRNGPVADPVAADNGRPPLDPELERRLDRELARFDG